MFLLLSCWIIAGVSAEDPPTMHYRERNSSLCLKIRKPPPHKDIKWRFNEKVIVMQMNVTPKYIGKVNYNPQDHSVCINKLNDTDSGSYQVSVTDGNYDESVEKHILIVEETVPTPVIRMSGQHSNLSAGFCNITVNCSIQDDWVWSVCDEDSCATSQRSLRKVNITISTKNRSIVCSGNNHVSTSNVSESIEARCSRKSNSEHGETSEPPTVQIIVIAVCVFFGVSLFCAVCVAKGLFSTGRNSFQGRTSSAQLIENQPVDAQPQPAQRVSTSSTSSQAEASYENVDTSQPCQTSSPTISPREGLGSAQSQKVDTVYSILQAPNVTSSLGKVDGSENTKGPKDVQKASASQYAILDEAQHPAKIDTVYSVLQKPKI
ncbi:T-lymphocyte surface antigen Ly-9 [Epinephelus fuscoguttatus]|uniref:T-lymphocyte surface antigen Ly-9 n=1 Tax=Epinephelus fuscoguttatus TaxID=293821 RepID=UPI0020D02766|nr:T-lymphocyte surface antigen Ly-9 [Epinephelus fuscoguttatus]